MQTLRSAAARGTFDFGWLKTAHSFSFGDYRDPAHMGFRSLRVINEDVLAGGGGFPTHPHADMEIVTYILSGALAHKDSLGTGAVIRPGEAQRMSAGTGIRHSEFNASSTDPVHLLQIWLLPSERGIAPGYEQKALPAAATGETRLDLIASPEGGDHAVTIRSDATISRALLAAGGTLAAPVTRGHAWLQVARGALTVGGKTLAAGDGLAVTGETALELASADGAEALLFDLGLPPPPPCRKDDSRLSASGVGVRTFIQSKEAPPRAAPSAGSLADPSRGREKGVAPQTVTP